LRGDINQAEFAAMMGVNKNTMGAYERGATQPQANFLKQLIERFDLNPSWLLLGEGPMHKTRDGSPEVSNGMDVSKELPKSMVAIPRWEQPEPGYFDFVPMAQAHLSAGGGAFVLTEDVLGYYAFRKEWLRRISSGAANVVLMTVRGTSMEPVIKDGDVVMIDTGRRRIFNGYVYAVRVGETILIKRLDVLGNGHVRLTSENAAEHPLCDLPMDQVHVLGQIIWYARELIRPE